MNELQLVTQQQILGKDFKVYGTAQEPLFKADDVATWIEHSNVSVMLLQVDDDEKRMIAVGTLNNAYSAWFLTENGLYEVLMLSRKPIAKEFKTKVKEILRTIRKTGSFALDIPQTYADALRLAADQAEKIEQQNKLLIEAKPKVEFFDAVAGSKEAIQMANVAKLLGIKGIGRNTLFEILRRRKILQFNNIPYQEYIDRGYFRIVEQKYVKPDGDTCINIKTLVYQKGLDYIRKIIKEC